MTRVAAIDVGSNALRLRIAELLPSGQLRDLTSLRQPVRLGHQVFVSGSLSPTTMDKAVEALQSFREAMSAAGVQTYRAVGTSALRDASNRELLLTRVEREARIKLEVISGAEEARLVRLAVSRALDLSTHSALLVDIGGGSVELTWMLRGLTQASCSLPLGTVRLGESFLEAGQPLSLRAQVLLNQYVERMLREAPFLTAAKPDLVVATGGNPEAIQQLCPAAELSLRAIDVAAMRQLTHQLAALPLEQRIEQYQLRPDRADVIVPAMLLLGHIAEKTHAASIAVPGVGLKDGVLQDLLEQRLEQQECLPIEEEALALGRHCKFDEAHGRQVAKLAAQLFDQLGPVHGLGTRERLWLRLAALLHDVGDFIGYESHHKHSYYIIDNAELIGLGPEARAIVANVARYHRKSLPDIEHAPYRKLNREARSVVDRLSLLLRVADAFDREHDGRVQSVRAVLENKQLTLLAQGDGDYSLSLWTAKKKAEPLGLYWGLTVQVLSIE